MFNGISDNTSFATSYSKAARRLLISVVVLFVFSTRSGLSHAASWEALNACNRDSMMSQELIIKSCTELMAEPSLVGKASFWPHVYRGIAHRNTGNFTQAISDFEVAIKLIPDSPHGYFERGKTLYKTDNCENAISDFDAAIKLEAKYAQPRPTTKEEATFAKPHLWKALCLSKTNKDADAVNEFNASIKLDRHSFSSYLNLGTAYYKLGKYNEALGAYSSAIAMGKHPYKNELAMAYYGMGIANAKLGNHYKAIDSYAKSIKINDKFPSVYLKRSESYSAMDNVELAKKDMDLFNARDK